MHSIADSTGGRYFIEGNIHDMYLRSKDKIFLTILMVLFSIGIIVGWLVIHQVVLLLSQTVVFFLLVTILMESHRRTQNDLKQLQEKSQESYQQVESLFYLFSTLKFRHPLPKMRGWAISPDFANVVISLIREHKPKMILEVGSGVSTLVTAYCLEEIGQGNVVSLDNDERFAKVSSANIVKHQLQAYATVIYAPLKEVAIQSKTWLWYETKELSNLEPIDMLIVDGPPHATQKLARYPALPILLPLLSDNAVVLLDDAFRSDEREIIRLWLKEFPNFSLREIDTEKGTVVLQHQTTESRSEHSYQDSYEGATNKMHL